MTVRPAHDADEPAIRRLQSFLSDPNPALVDAAVAGAGHLLVSVAAPDGPPVGYALTIEGERTATLAELVVAPGYRREGRATALVEATVSSLGDRGIETLSLTVHEDDAGARAFYRETGFGPAGRVPDYFPDGAAIRMVREL